MRKIGADKIYTDFCLSINLIEKNNKRSCFSKTLAFNSEASTKQVAAINKEDCNYFIYFPLAHLHESVIKKDFLKASQ